MTMPKIAAQRVKFTKMDGLGNDFVILDARDHALELSKKQVQTLSDRSNPDTHGCDQVIVLYPPQQPGDDIFMRIYNADGGEVDACGNASRCVAWLLMQETSAPQVMLRTTAERLAARRTGNIRVSVDMGKPRLSWQEIPLSEARDTLNLGIHEGSLHDPVGVSMGNPHAVFFVPDVEAVDLATSGPILEHHPLFPKRANIGVAQIQGPQTMRLRVWERGAGETLACGTGACAALVAAHRRGLLGRNADIQLNGGILHITWDSASDHVFMEGDVSTPVQGTTFLP